MLKKYFAANKKNSVKNSTLMFKYSLENSNCTPYKGSCINPGLGTLDQYDRMLSAYNCFK